MHDQEHLLTETLVVEEYVPGHGERQGPRFEASRHHLVNVLKLPCWACGATDHLEAHHYPIEFSMANDVDWSKDGKIRQDFPHFDWAGFDAAGDPSFFYDSPANLLILCKRCHTGKNEGIHNKPHPLWVIRRYAKAGVQLTPEDRA